MTLADSIRRLDLARSEIEAAMLPLSPLEQPEYGKLDAARQIVESVRQRLVFYAECEEHHKGTVT